MTATQPDTINLPENRAQFIAYSKTRNRRVLDGNRRVSCRSEVYIRYYPQLKVAKYREGGRHGNGPAADGFDTDYVTFDGSEIGLQEEFGASLRVGDPAMEPLRQMLRDAAKNETWVTDIVIETSRKKKRSDNNKAITAFMGITTLRGLPTTEGGPKVDGEAKACVVNTLALVGGQPTTEIHSDPSEWADLWDNKVGEIMPPEGWTHIVDDDKGESYIIADPANASQSDAPAAAGPNQQATAGQQAPAQGRPANQADQAAPAGMDPMELRNFLEATIRGAIGEALAAQRGRKTSKQGFDEGLPYDPRTNNGLVNLGGYLVAAECSSYRWAHGQLTSAAAQEESAPEVTDEQVQLLTERVMQVADRVQAGAYGHDIEPNRVKSSHTEARRWVQWLIESGRPEYRYPYGADDDTVHAWGGRVIAEATRLLAAAGQRTGQYLEVRFAPPSKRAAAQQQAGNATAPGATQAEQAQVSEGEADAAAQIRAALAATRNAWADLATLQSIKARLAETGLGEVPVGVTGNPGEVPTFHYPAPEGQPSWPMGMLVARRIDKLTDPAQQPAPQDTAPQPPAQGPAPTQAQPPADPQPSPAPAAPDPGVQDLVARLNAAGTVDAVADMVQAMRGANATQAPVAVHAAPNGRPRYDADPSTSQQVITLGEAAETIAHGLGAAAPQPTQQAPQVPATPTQAPNAQPTQPAPQEGVDPARKAQQIADEAVSADSAEHIQALRERAVSGGLIECGISIGGSSGTLRTFLDYRGGELSNGRVGVLAASA